MYRMYLERPVLRGNQVGIERGGKGQAWQEMVILWLAGMAHKDKPPKCAVEKEEGWHEGLCGSPQAVQSAGLRKELEGAKV